MFEINYIDAKSKTCTATSAVAGTIADFEELRARLADDPVLGRFSGEVGTPPGAGKIVLSTFKRAGANPFVLLSGTSTASFVTITLTRTDFSKAN